MLAYRLVLIAIFAASLGTFAALLMLDAPYGRHLREGWGIALRARPAWFLMEFPAVLAIFAMALVGTMNDPVALVLLALWEGHYLYRSLVYPFFVRRSDARNMPISLIAMAILYNTANGYVNGYRLFVSPHRYPADWFTDPRFIVGIVLFAAGMITHLRSDAILRSLRRPGEHNYVIPHGALFRYVSSPNYLGEIVQWCGFALASWSVAGLSFAVFTIANLAPRALSHHRWYRETFDDYPENRKALIPGIL